MSSGPSGFSASTHHCPREGWRVGGIPRIMDPLLGRRAVWHSPARRSHGGTRRRRSRTRSHPRAASSPEGLAGVQRAGDRRACLGGTGHSSATGIPATNGCSWQRTGRRTLRALRFGHVGSKSQRTWDSASAWRTEVSVSATVLVAPRRGALRPTLTLREWSCWLPATRPARGSPPPAGAPRESTRPGCRRCQSP